MDFKLLKSAVAGQFEKMKKHKLFITGTDKDELWNLYLDSFPEGTNLIYRERREYDCSCCRQFIKNIGSVVNIIDGKLVSIWDCKVDNENYQTVVDALAQYVKNKPVVGLYYNSEKVVGIDKNFEDLVDGIQTWEHFFVNVPPAVVKKKDEINSSKGTHTDSFNVLKRSFEEITSDAAKEVLDLIAQGSLYRGEEHKMSVQTFLDYKRPYECLPEEKKDLYVWTVSTSVGMNVSRIRNTAIGTLLVDLSEGVDLEEAVRKFEQVVAPMNYKRPTSLISQRMIDNAKKTVEELGLTSALERRFANENDIPINDVLFSYKTTKSARGGDLFDGLPTKKKEHNFKNVKEMSIEKFLKDVVPTASELEIFMENRLMPNLVSLIAPEDPTAENMFKWHNKLSWSYKGGVTDSIKERVKAAGGKIEGDVCIRLSWNNYDDLDLHLFSASGGTHIYYAQKRDSYTGAWLDVDMNAGGPRSRTPVENITIGNRKHLHDKEHWVVKVHQFAQRENIDVGFVVQVETKDDIREYGYEKPVRGTIEVLYFYYDKKEDKIVIKDVLPASSVQKEVWGIKTEDFVKVKNIMLSPNYWGERPVGNKHYLFMLEGCKNEEPTRGFFNEYLNPILDKHRKVFEILGGKLTVPYTDNQLSGVGFSSTSQNHFLVRVSGSFNRIVKVTI